MASCWQGQRGVPDSGASVPYSSHVHVKGHPQPTPSTSVKGDAPVSHTMTFKDLQIKYYPGYEKSEKIKQLKASLESKNKKKSPSTKEAYSSASTPFSPTEKSLPSLSSTNSSPCKIIPLNRDSSPFRKISYTQYDTQSFSQKTNRNRNVHVTKNPFGRSGRRQTKCRTIQGMTSTMYSQLR